MENFIPNPNTIIKEDFNCPISEEINVKQYNVLIDSDFMNNQVYLNMGYDHNREYDSSFYLSSEDAYKLGEQLMQIATKNMNDNIIIKRSNNWRNNLINLLQNSKIYSISIGFKRLYTKDPEDNLFGLFVLNISYSLKEDNRYTIQAQILSDDMKNKDETYCDELEEQLKLSDIPIIAINKLAYKNLLHEMNDILNNWMKENKTDTPPKQEIHPMIPNNLQDQVKDIADRVMKKIHETSENK